MKTRTMADQKSDTTSQPEPQTEHMETHAHHLHKAPGKNFWHYFFEFFMLFLAVTLGFFVENQREHFVEQRRERQFMSLLLGDLKTDTTAFKRVIMSYKNTSKTMDSLIDLLKNPERNKWTGKIYYLAKQVVFDTLFATVNKTFEQMKSSGNLRLIHNPVLIDSLGFYYYNFQELENFGPGRMLFETRHDLFASYDKLFDAAIFQRMMSPPDSSGVIIPPEGNPPLLTHDPDIINEICMRVHNMYFVKRVVIGLARRNIKRATNLIKKIEEEYQLGSDKAETKNLQVDRIKNFFMINLDYKQLLFSIGFITLMSYCSLAQVAKPTNAKKEPAKNTLSTYEKYIDEHNDAHLKEVSEFISIPSISSIPSHKPDVEKAATWIVNKLKSIGITNARIMPTEGLPVVYGSWENAAGKPTVLIYGHYDVQPVKDSAEWHCPPFIAKIEDGKIFGRGATDDKGGVMIPIWAVEAVLNIDKKLPVNVKFIFEGEEEIGSVSFHRFFAKNKDLLLADFALNTDAGQISDSTPGIFMAVRGGAQMEFTVKTANIDAHSGMFGGKTPNAAKALSEIIASLYNKDGTIAVEGFYDNVVPLTKQEREMIKKIPYDPADDMKALGTIAETGDTNYLPLERIWYRPALEVTGIQSGYTAKDGFLNIIPGSAMGRINCRLVNNQSPKEVTDLLVKHINKNCPTGATVSFRFINTGANPLKFPSDTKAYNYVSAALIKIYGNAPLHIAMGGSVGSLIDIKEQLGVYPYSLGFQRADERQHGANEFLRLSDMRKGQLVYCYYFKHLGEEEKK